MVLGSKWFLKNKLLHLDAGASLNTSKGEFTRAVASQRMASEGGSMLLW